LKFHIHHPYCYHLHPHYYYCRLHPLRPPILVVVVVSPILFLFLFLKYLSILKHRSILRHIR
jgi:hypothetical protein